MKLTLLRYSGTKESTMGLLYIDGTFQCYTIEDEHREHKKAGETRIPAGIYEILLRDSGGMVGKYKDRFTFHKGMLHLQNVPGFKYVYIHIGNTTEDTDGCILVGDLVNNNRVSNGNLYRSVKAYRPLYIKLLEAIETGEKVIIEIKDVIL